MARVNYVTRAAKDQGTCKCGTAIQKGMPYRWWKFRFGGKRKRCMGSACNPRRSELTQSEILGTLYDLQDDLEAQVDACETVQEVADLAEEAAGRIREELAELISEKVENMVEGFGHETASSDELAERGYAFEQWADDVENTDIEVPDEVEEPGEEPAEPGEEPAEPATEPKDDPKAWDEYQEALAAHQEATDAWDEYQEALDVFESYEAALESSLEEAKEALRETLGESPE